MITEEILSKQFNASVRLEERRPGIMQLFAPLFHEDGDMVEIFLEERPTGLVRISDYASTIMRLSYTYELDTDNKRRVFDRIVSENMIQEDDGNLYIDSSLEHVYASVMQFAQAIAKISSMRQFTREVVKSMFYELLEKFVLEDLAPFNPHPSILPIPDRDDLEVDYQLDAGPRPVFLFGVKDKSRARLTTISCLEFQRAQLPFRSMVVHEDFESLSRKDRNRITNTVDKQFTSLDEFKQQGYQALAREAISLS